MRRRRLEHGPDAAISDTDATTSGPDATTSGPNDASTPSDGADVPDGSDGSVPRAWSGIVPLESGIGDVRSFAVAMSKNGDAMAVWTQPDTGSYVVWAARFTAAGGWTQPQKLVTEDTQGAGRPRVSVSANGMIEPDEPSVRRVLVSHSSGASWDAAGDAIAVWTQSEGARVNLWANVFAEGRLSA